MTVTLERSEVRVSTGDQFLALLDKIPGLQKIGHEYKSPCPWCGEATNTWEGEDRLVYFFQDTSGAPRVWCRHAAANALHDPIHPIEDLFWMLGYKVVVSDWQALLSDPKVQRAVRVRRATGAAKFYNFEQVMAYHTSGKREFWSDMGFTGLTIRNFMLGTGKVAISGNTLYPHERGIVPIPMFTSNERFILKTRPMVEEDMPNRHLATAGQPTTLFFTNVDHDLSVVESDTLYITEGERSHIAIWQMGLFPTASSSAGAGVWYDEWTVALLTMHGFRRIVFIQDNDQQGANMVVRVGRSFRSIPISEQLEIVAVDWGDKKPKYDGYDVLAEYGTKAGAEYLRELVGEAETTPALEKGGYVEVMPGDSPVWPVPISLEELRGEGRTGMTSVVQEFVDNYKTLHMPEGEPTLKLLRTPPGAGKSYVLVRQAERLARERMARIQREMDARQDEIKALEDQLRENPDPATCELIEEKIARLQKAPPAFTVLYAGPFIAGWGDVQLQGADMDLWFNFEGRNEENCENYTIAQAVGERGYNVMRAVCHSSCPFARECRESGYLSQFDKLREKPIAYVRHEHLRVKDLVDNAKYVFIDEDPTRLIAKPITLTVDDLHANVDWAAVLEPSQYNMIDRLSEALREALVRAPRQSGFATSSSVLSGRQALQHIDNVLYDKNWTLALGDIIYNLADDTLDFIETYLPPGLSDIRYVNRLPRRGLVDTLRVIKHEVGKYYAPDDPTAVRGLWNSRIHFINGLLQVFPMEPFDIKRTRPVVVADATADVAMYERAFLRQVEVYDPAIRKDDTKTTVFIGSEYPKTQLYRNLHTDPPEGYSEEQIALVLEQYDVLKSSDLDEIILNLSFLNQDYSAPPNQQVAEAVTFIENLAGQHDSLLVVSYIYVEQWLKKYLRHKMPSLYHRLYFGHYGGLRGTNVFKDVAAVLLIGTPRLSDMDMQINLQAWFAFDPEPLDFRTERIAQHYHGRDDGYRVRMFSDPRTWAHIDYWEAAEMQQCAERIRPHSSATPKHVYVLSSRPAVRWVTDVVSKSDQLYQWRELPELIDAGRQAIADYLARNPGKNRMPQRKFREALGISAPRARRIYKEITEGLDNEEVD